MACLGARGPLDPALGTCYAAIDLLIKRAIASAYTEATNRSDQAGSPSFPSAVW